MLWSLALVVLRLLLGRVFCGWVCPLGTLHAIGRLDLPSRLARSQTPRSLVALAADEVLPAGRHAGDGRAGRPLGVRVRSLVLLYRSTATALLPGHAMGLEEDSTAIYRADPGVGRLRWPSSPSPLIRPSAPPSSTSTKQAFLGGGLMLAALAACCCLNTVPAAVLVPLSLSAGRRCWASSDAGGRSCAARSTRETCNQLRPVRAWPATVRPPLRPASSGSPRVPRLPQLHRLLPPRQPGLHLVGAVAKGAAATQPVDLSQRATMRRPRWAAWPRWPVCGARPQARGNALQPRSGASAGGARGARVPPALHGLRAVHEGLPDRRPAARLERGRPGRALDAAAGAARSASATTPATSAARSAPPRPSSR